MSVIDAEAVTPSPALPVRPRIEGPSAWIGADMRKREAEWTYRLSPAEIAEIEAAVAAVQSRGLDLADIRRGDFPLPTLGPVLDRLRAEVLDGRGFVLLRGMPVEDRPIADSATAYWGVGTYFGSARSQNAKGHLLGHVYDLGQGLSATNPNLRSYATAERQNFHIDRCDVVALLCLRRAKSGGLSTIVSSMTVHNVDGASAGPICWTGCTGRFPSTGAARCRRARRRSTKRRCSTSMPATSRCCIPGCISARRSGFPRRGGSQPKISKRSTCSPSWQATRNCGST